MLPPLVSRALVVSVGVCYPAYATFKAIRTKRLSEYVNWMMYWAVFAPLLCSEPLAEYLLGWSSFYYDFRAILVLWLACPATNGASFVYRRYLHPTLKRYESKIDNYAEYVTRQAKTAMSGCCAQAVAFVRELTRRAAQNFPDDVAMSSENIRAARAHEDGNGDSPTPESTARELESDSRKNRKRNTEGSPVGTNRI